MRLLVREQREWRRRWRRSRGRLLLRRLLRRWKLRHRRLLQLLRREGMRLWELRLRGEELWLAREPLLLRRGEDVRLQASLEGGWRHAVLPHPLLLEREGLVVVGDERDLDGRIRLSAKVVLELLPFERSEH